MHTRGGPRGGWGAPAGGACIPGHPPRCVCTTHGHSAGSVLGSCRAQIRAKSRRQRLVWDGGCSGWGWSSVPRVPHALTHSTHSARRHSHPCDCQRPTWSHTRNAGSSPTRGAPRPQPPQLLSTGGPMAAPRGAQRGAGTVWLRGGGMPALLLCPTPDPVCRCTQGCLWPSSAPIRMWGHGFTLGTEEGSPAPMQTPCGAGTAWGASPQGCTPSAGLRCARIPAQGTEAGGEVTCRSVSQCGAEKRCRNPTQGRTHCTAFPTAAALRGDGSAQPGITCGELRQHWGSDSHTALGCSTRL